MEFKKSVYHGEKKLLGVEITTVDDQGNTKSNKERRI